MKHVIRFGIQMCFLIGIGLLLINVFGLFFTLRNPNIYREVTPFENDIFLTQEQVFDVIDEEIFDKKSYVKKINQVVNNGVAFYWDDEGINSYNLRIPFYENYLLNIASYVKPEIYLKYELMDYKRAIERGVGLCSQQSIIVAEIFADAGINSYIVGLSGHVVATVLIDNQNDEWWIVDPKYGVIIPHSMDLIEKEPEIIAPYYRDRGYTENDIIELVDIYGKDGNLRIYGNGARNYALVNYRREKAAYILIWVIPMLCMFPKLISQFAGGELPTDKLHCQG